MTGDGGEYLRPEDLKELGDDSLPSSQFLDGMNYLRYSLEGARSDRYSPKANTWYQPEGNETLFQDVNKKIDIIMDT